MAGPRLTAARFLFLLDVSRSAQVGGLSGPASLDPQSCAATHARVLQPFRSFDSPGIRESVTTDGLRPMGTGLLPWLAPHATIPLHPRRTLIAPAMPAIGRALERAWKDVSAGPEQGDAAAVGLASCRGSLAFVEKGVAALSSSPYICTNRSAGNRERQSSFTVGERRP